MVVCVCLYMHPSLSVFVRACVRVGAVRAHRDIFRGYIPEYLYTQKPREEWTRVVLSAYTSLLNGKSQADVKGMFLDSLRRWPLFGAAFFPVKVRAPLHALWPCVLCACAWRTLCEPPKHVCVCVSVCVCV
jgi:hypothetical protein